jgi:N-acetylglucosaminyldiphosphoundecaprenol N-acetyl-beta-D-mannosaminyltransferase
MGQLTGSSRQQGTPGQLVLFGLPFNDMSMCEAVKRLNEYINSDTSHIVFTVNVAMLVQWHRSPLLQRIYQESDLLTIDGMALVYASRLLRAPACEALSGSLLFYEIMALAQAKGYTIFLLGAEVNVLHAARKRLEQNYGPARVVGMHDGYFEKAQAPDVIRLINAARPDILLLGMSSPLKEQFASTYRDQMRVPLILGVGGMFDIVAGRRRLVPAWIRVLCLEWLWRLSQEPRRLWWRYATTNSIFLCWLAREMISCWVVAPVSRRVVRLGRRQAR